MIAHNASFQVVPRLTFPSLNTSEWPWFRENIDLICMILSKTDYSIATNYDTQLVDPQGGLLELGEEVRSKLVQTRLAVLNITESKDYAGAHVALMRASNVIRFPFLDPVNVCQAEILKRLRALNNQERLSEAELDEKYVLGDALILSISGIAQGLRNSG
jgi:phosphoenolpyruvate carboxylase